MNTISSYFIEFMFYSFLGWVWESIYCTIKTKEWSNRGFFYGPICPIYGASVLLADLLFGWLHNSVTVDIPLVGIFLICMIGSAIIEFTTHWYLEKRYHATWWDYSDQPLNIQGRICLPVSICFGLAGVVIVKFLLPVSTSVQAVIPLPVTETLSILLAVVFGADYAITEISLSSLLDTVKEYKKEFDEKAEAAYQQLADRSHRMEESFAAAKETSENRRAENAKAREEWRQSLAERYTNRMNRPQRQILKNIKKLDIKEGPKKFEHLPQLEELKMNLKNKKKEK